MLDQWRTALRSLAHRRGLASMVVLTLALGIGANSAIFSAVDAVLLKPLPYPAADRLVSVYERNTGLRQATQLVAPGRLEEWNAQNQTFVALGASYFENMTDTTGAEPERVAAMNTSPRFFQVLGVTPALGRLPTPEEERFGGPPVLVVSDAFWRRRLGADPSVLGRALRLGGISRPIVAVMPPSFRYPTAETDVWVPTRAQPSFLAVRTARLYTTIGRLKPGVTIARALDDLNAVQTRLGDQYPSTDKGWGASLMPLKEEQIGGVRRSLWLLLGSVGLVLLAACGNVACLLLADATRREHEMAIRFALGADRRRVVAELIREGLMLALAGSLGGLLLARWGLSALRSMATELPRIADVQVDVRLVLFTFAVGVTTTLLFALAPALQAARSDPADALSRGGRGHTGGRQLLQRLLVGTQVALAIVLLTGAGLMIRSFARTQDVSLGLDSDRVMTFRMSAQWSERFDAVVQRQARTIARLETIPGVEAAAFSQLVPAGTDVPPNEFQIYGRDARERTFAIGRSVSSGYFRTLHIPVLLGETCSSDPAVPVFSSALVTRAFADRYFPSEDPIGHAFVSPGQLSNRTTKIVGVVEDVRESGLLKEPEPLIYWCGYNPYWPDQRFLVRSRPDRHVSMTAIRAALREIEPGRAVYAERSLSDLVWTSLSPQRLNAILLSMFAATALLLAGLGLYGVLSQLVSARRREIGVRMALGARPSRILSDVVVQAASLTGLGMAAGLSAAYVLARFMATLVFGISVRDPLTFVLVPLALGLVTAISAIVPARRAARVDPMDVLRD
jgi:putative ABC transport system permease protein